MKAVALACIRLYRRHVSPRKRYGCACRVHEGRASCSWLGFRAVRRYGALGGLQVLRQRLAHCGDVYRRHHPQPGWRRQQQGSCDLPCDIPCDGPDLRCAGNVCSSCDCGNCDSGRKEKRPRKHRSTR
jgi:uncharacterized protein